MALKLCGRKILLARTALHSNVRNQGYIVLIPEIGEDLPEKNPLLQQNGLPEFNNITIENCMAAIGKQTLEFENDIRDLESKIAKNQTNDIFEDVIDPLELQGNALDMTWGLSKTLYLGHSTKMPTKNYLAIHERAKRARAAKYNSKIIYDQVLKELNKKEIINSDPGEEEKNRIIKKFALEGKLNGLSLGGKNREKLVETLSKLNKERADFKMKIENSTNKFGHFVEDQELIKEMPDWVVKRLCESGKEKEGPWKVTLQPQVAIPFMEYCPDRLVRWNIWQGMVGRGGGYNKRENETSTNLEQIRALRQNEAKLLGYENFVQMSMETKMAGSIENVNNMISTLLEVAYPCQVKELGSLFQFAMENGFEGKRIELWDLPYWRTKHRKSLSEIDESELKQYFPMEKVLNGLFDITQKLFKINIVKRSKEKVSTWHKNVQYFDVFEGEKLIGGFYLDAFEDENLKPSLQNGWMVGIQNKSTISNTIPLAALVFNFSFSQGNCLLSFEQVKLLFNKFGQALQHLLTRANYSEVAGLSNIEWDAVEVPGHVLTHFLFNKHFIDKITSNGNLPQDIFDKLIAMNNHLAGVNLCRELYLSSLDLQLYASSKTFWLDIVKKLWPEFRAFPLDKVDSHPCSFTQIFSEEYAAAYYCHVWSRIIAADVYSAFYEAKSDEAQLEEVGKRFRDTFLALGGACHSSQVFRKFRGRDPSPKALLKSLGLKVDKEEKKNT